MCVTCGLCAVVCLFRGKTHVVWGREVREVREFKEFKEFREKVASGLFFLPYGNDQVPLSQRGI